MKYPFSQFLGAFETPSLGRDQSQDDELICRNVFKGLKGAGPFVIIFKQEAVRFDSLEKLPANRLIAPLRQPPAALVAAS